MQNSPKAKKAAKTRAKSARFRAGLAANAAARLEKEISEKTLIEKRAKAYRDMEPHVCDLARAAQLAMLASDDEGLFLFAVEQFDEMAERFRKRYYAEEFHDEN
jgi:hypothetical protein